MRILRSVVAPSTTFMAFRDSKITGCSSIRSEVIRDQLVGDKAIFIQQLEHEFQGRPLVPPGLDQNVEHLTLGVHGTPEVDQATIDLEIDLASRPGELHPQALPDPYVSLSAHTAPDVRL
jgi:hypothetical protein